MAIVLVPTVSGPDAPPYVQRTLLDGLPYRLSFRWNERSGVWCLSIGTESNDLVCGPISIRNWVPLLGQYRGTPGLPPGELVAMAFTDHGRDAGHEELGTRVQLYYAEAVTT